MKLFFANNFKILLFILFYILYGDFLNLWLKFFMLNLNFLILIAKKFWNNALLWALEFIYLDFF